MPRAGSPTSAAEHGKGAFALKTISRLDGFLSGHMAPVVLFCVAMGICFPEVLSRLNAVTTGLFAFMTFSNSLGGGFRELADVARHPLPVAVIFGLLHVVMPLAALGLGTLCFPDAPLFTTGLVLEYSVPTAVAALMWVGISRGNGSLCLSVVMLDTLLSPVVIPVTMKLLVGSVVELDAWGMIRDLLVMVAIPALAAMALYQGTKGAAAVKLKPRLSLPAKGAMLLIIIANATGCAPFLRDLTPTLVRVMIVVFCLCLLGFFLGYWAARLLGWDFPTVQTVAITSGMRNISAGAVLAQAYFPGDVLFPVAFSPVFLQATTAFIVRALRATKPGRADQAAYEARQSEVHVR